MSNIQYNYATFSVTDFRGSTSSLSSYNLELTPLVFAAQIPDTLGTNNRVSWDFGDGESSSVLVPSHAYKFPGAYNVRLFIYNNFNQAVLASAEHTVVIKDFIEDTFNVTVNGALYTQSGVLSPPLTITQSIPYRLVSKPVEVQTTVVTPTPAPGFLPGSYNTDRAIETYTSTTVTYPLPTLDDITKASTISYTVSGANTLNYFYLEPNKYNHLEAYNCILQRVYTPGIGGYELVHLPHINVSLSAIYAILSGYTLQHSMLSSATSEIVGYSGSDVFYYRDDLPTDAFTISFKKNAYNYTNPLNITLNGTITQSLNVDRLTITSNGVDGDGEPLNTFHIDSNKFCNTNIHFTIKTKDASLNTIKSYNSLSLNPLSSDYIYVSLSSSSVTIPTSSYTVTDLTQSLSGFSSGGFIRGCITYTDTLTTPLTGVMITALFGGLSAGDYILAAETGDNILSEGSEDIIIHLSPNVGASTPFNIYPKNYYTLYKMGEEFDGEAMYKSLRFQETLLDKEVFFTNFLGSIFGDLNADTEALGKKVYERIHNFVDNTVNIDTAEIIRLLSLGDMVDYQSTVFDKNLVSFPNKIQRLVSLLSINKNKLFGEKNKYTKNFNPYGTTSKDEFGKNLGDVIDVNTYSVSATQNIVAYEKFSRIYKLINTYQPLCASVAPTGSVYSILDYDQSWGWPLVLPQSFIPADITKYYSFYEFNNEYAGDIVGGALNFDLTTNLSFDTQEEVLIADEGIYECILLDTLYQSLSLTK